MASCHRPSVATWPRRPATGVTRVGEATAARDWRRGWSRRRRQGKEREAAGSGGVLLGGGEEEAGKIFCGADQEKKIFCGADQEKPIEERRKPLPMELEREAVSVRNDLSHRMVNRMGDIGG